MSKINLLLMPTGKSVGAVLEALLLTDYPAASRFSLRSPFVVETGVATKLSEAHFLQGDFLLMSTGKSVGAVNTILALTDKLTVPRPSLILQAVIEASPSTQSRP